MHKELNVFFENGKITEVSNRVPTDETVIDAKGLYVAPGMIDVHTLNGDYLYTKGVNR